ncbi:MAG TPA: pseudouridine synthase [Roseiarcus sp.]|nr:pseudouridine synthase [Roseiarcus sp.]
MTDQPPSNEKGRGEKPRLRGKKAYPGERIAKAMARAGLCSRRDAEAWIAAGRVSVNGQILKSPAVNVTARDEIRVDGAPLVARERTRLFMFHKPRGLVTTARDPEGRPTIFQALPEGAPRLVAIGRLDINTEGLLLLTNDGGLARVLELPATGWLRRYRVRAHGTIDQAALDPLTHGATIDGIAYGGIEAKLDRAQGANVWLTIGLREGKNREIKRVLEHLGLKVNRLIRVSFGPFQLGGLEEGELVEAPTRVVREQIGPRLAREAGADFEAPLRERPRDQAEQRASRRPGGRPSPDKSEKGEFRGARLRREKSSDPAEGERAGRPAQRNDRRAPRSRKYIAAIRAEEAAAARGPRRRAEAGSTHDRKGREIKVERRRSVEESKNRGDNRKDGTRQQPGRRFSRGGPKDPRHRGGPGGPRRGPHGARRR